EAVRLLAEMNDFRRVQTGRIRTTTLDKDRIRKLKSDEYLDFISNTNDKSEYKKEMRIGKIRKQDQKLIDALSHGGADAFRQALAEGADPNLIPPGDELPLIFTLAADGMLEWVEALLATHRCDLTKTDARGFRASIAPGAMSRRLAKEPTAEGLAQRFRRIADMLREEEFRQILASGQDPFPDSPEPPPDSPE
ncbi:MAG: hypothetical protein RIC52_05130, partial [Amphiplicatus sp.]